MGAFRHLAVTDHADHLAVRFLEPLLTEDIASDVAGELESVAVSEEVKTIRVSFAGVTLMCSWMLGKLIALHRKLQRLHRPFVLCEIPPCIRETLARTRLDYLFEIAEETQASAF